MTTLTAAIISAAASVTVGLLTLMGVIITNSRANKDIEQKIAVAQAVTDTKLAELTRDKFAHFCISFVSFLTERLQIFVKRFNVLERYSVRCHINTIFLVWVVYFAKAPIKFSTYFNATSRAKP